MRARKVVYVERQFSLFYFKSVEQLNLEYKWTESYLFYHCSNWSFGLGLNKSEWLHLYFRLVFGVLILYEWNPYGTHSEIESRSTNVSMLFNVRLKRHISLSNNNFVEYNGFAVQVINFSIDFCFTLSTKWNCKNEIHYSLVI